MMRQFALLLVAAPLFGCGEKLPLDNTSSSEGGSSRIQATGGTALSGYFGNFVTGVPQATVTDKQGHPLAGVIVTFAAQGGGRLTGAITRTDSTGHASPTSWRLGASGEQTVTASMSGAGTISFRATASSPPGSVFRIEVRYAPGTTPSVAQSAAFDAAVARWSQIILRGGAPYPIHELVPECGDIQGEIVDGVVITADLQPIDGVGKVLASAGPCILRDLDYLPAQGYMKFDTADLAALESNGQLGEVILHEMGHVLGFGSIWEIAAGAGLPVNAFLIRVPPENPVFSGAASLSALFGLAGPTGFNGTGVPVEATGSAGTAFSHWRESVFGSELMTGWLNAGANPLSALTINQFRDLGYLVNDALGDSYSFAALLQAAVQAPVQLVEQPLTGPLLVIDRSGRAVRTVPRIYK